MKMARIHFTVNSGSSSWIDDERFLGFETEVIGVKLEKLAGYARTGPGAAVWRVNICSGAAAFVWYCANARSNVCCIWSCSSKLATILLWSCKYIHCCKYLCFSRALSPLSVLEIFRETVMYLEIISSDKPICSAISLTFCSSDRGAT